VVELQQHACELVCGGRAPVGPATIPASYIMLKGGTGGARLESCSLVENGYDAHHAERRHKRGRLESCSLVENGYDALGLEL
jgi:hypothetical protein